MLKGKSIQLTNQPIISQETNSYDVEFDKCTIEYVISKHNSFESVSDIILERSNISLNDVGEDSFYDDSSLWSYEKTKDVKLSLSSSKFNSKLAKVAVECPLCKNKSVTADIPFQYRSSDEGLKSIISCKTEGCSFIRNIT